MLVVVPCPFGFPCRRGTDVSYVTTLLSLTIPPLFLCAVSLHTSIICPKPTILSSIVWTMDSFIASILLKNLLLLICLKCKLVFATNSTIYSSPMTILFWQFFCSSASWVYYTSYPCSYLKQVFVHSSFIVCTIPFVIPQIDSVVFDKYHNFYLWLVPSPQWEYNTKEEYKY